MTPEIESAIASSPFTKLGLAAPIVRAVLEEEYTEPSPVQGQVIPLALAGKDVMAGAQTGTGKTAAFVLPMLQALSASSDRGIKALILTPTRELAGQIGERIEAYGKYLDVRHTVIYGGVSQRNQEIALRQSPALVVATPGRLLDLMKQRFVDLSGLTHFVLDEMDRMLDMGFVHDVRRIVSTIPANRQTLFFSATIAPEVEKLARGMLREPERISISPVTTTAPLVEQSVVFVAQADKRGLLERVLREEKVERALVFTRTKHGANRLSAQLEKAGFGVAAIHGNKTQGARQRALEGFRSGTTPVLVATDVAARGIDVEGVSLVVNFDMPNIAESYVHRIGRTGRAGASGRAISFCDREERAFLGDIERLIRKRLPVDGDDPRGSEPLPAVARPGGGSGGGGGGGGARPGASSGRPAQGGSTQRVSRPTKRRYFTH
ncbi:MAG TPA: DEAD/DEAH box helicase [Polyangiaceae bacterium]|jgi:ATP-dependent RNA helicase RhlE|nr:DEAD/DEAH box helicase [Polyangiaceae bacterium]